MVYIKIPKSNVTAWQTEEPSNLGLQEIVLENTI